MKNVTLRFCLFAALGATLMSCLNSKETEIDEWNLSNSQIKSFTLKNDSIPALAGTKFTIDQLNGLIFNRDSMPYGTKIDRLVVCSLTYAVGPVLAVEITQTATGATAVWNQKDSINVSGPVHFNVRSADGKTVKRYTLQINIHQQQPDSIAWTAAADPLTGRQIEAQTIIAHNNEYLRYIKEANGYGLFRSSDAVNWTAASLSGLPTTGVALRQLTLCDGTLYLPTATGTLLRSANGSAWALQSATPQIVALLGCIEKSEPIQPMPVVAAIVRDSGSLRFATMQPGGAWQIGETVPEGFPTTGFSSIGYQRMYYHRLMIAAGKDQSNRLSSITWETMDGLSWVQLNSGKQATYDAREGASLIAYDGHLYLIGGLDASGAGKHDIYRSTNSGVTWTPAPRLMALPAAFQARGYATTIVDGLQFIRLYGGRKQADAATELDEQWNGRINRLGFKH